MHRGQYARSSFDDGKLTAQQLLRLMECNQKNMTPQHVLVGEQETIAFALTVHNLCCHCYIIHFNACRLEMLCLLPLSTHLYAQHL